MFTIFILTFREFLEAFLIIGIFLGSSKKLQLKKEKEILLASLTGILLSLLLPIGVFFLGGQTNFILTEAKADLLEGYLLIFSGIFIAYVVFSLHQFMEPKKENSLAKAHIQMQSTRIFDLALFLTITFFIVREGFEIALLTATTSLFSTFLDNLKGLLLGFATAGIVGAIAYFSYLKISLQKIFLYTECFIIILGAAMVKNGLSILLNNYFTFNMANILPLHFGFLPDETTIVGHTLKNLTGIDREFSLLALFIMLLYITIIYFLFLHRKIKR